ncbi:putative protein serine/threonine kinase [Heterostelium album PN500]|uniref:Protein kinase domain-containing protein n=1 Tax=Heterostelium pallidum (strain ATCC 26659 / Pp 5 / PN500) TaxID=670386 RepID=D3B1N2_HETP5|nr:putative protein serine/threonine kinase [Heterostelium album PN500]EFA85206.1 putative protein serine/threonine kinase [Heterostelium album PN500]|eukprot:XP_020437315.1 putative protein serine/threonine kinase [Heterostelium album PN500]
MLNLEREMLSTTPTIFLLLYISIEISGLILLIYEFKYHKSLFNNVKTLFYCLLFSNCTTRAIFLLLGIIGSFQAGSFAANFPSYLFITLTAFLGIQILQFIPKDSNFVEMNSREDEEIPLIMVDKAYDNGVKKYTMFVILSNIIMYVSSFMVYSISSFKKEDKRKTNSESSDVDDGFDQALEYYFIAYLVLLILSHGYIAYKRKTIQKLLRGKGHSIEKLQILLIICILSRVIILATNPSYSNSDIDFWSGGTKTVATTIIYFLLGEIVPCLLMISIQFLLPYHDSSYNQESITSPTSIGMGHSFQVLSPIDGIFSASGATIHDCNSIDYGVTKICVVKVISKNDPNFKNIRNEAKIYKRIRKNKPSEIIEFDKVSESAGKLYLFLEKMHTNLFSYINIRKIVGEKRFLAKFNQNSLLLLKSCDTGQNSQILPNLPLKFEHSELKNCLLHIAKGIEFLHNLKIAHRDLRPHNIFLTLDGSNLISYSKIGDFDNSIMQRTKKPSIVPNTYANPSHIDYTLQYANDVLQFGYLIHFLITFEYDEKRFAVDQYNPPSWSEIQCPPNLQGFYKLYTQCIHIEYQQRLKASQIVQELQHL